MNDTTQTSKKERRAQRRAQRDAGAAAQRRRKFFRRYAAYAAVALVIAVAGYWMLNRSGGGYTEDKQAEAFDPAKVCTTDAQTVMHIHQQLTIRIDGKEEAIPANVGIVSPTCMRPMHTHDATGTIHVESPVVRDFTLGELFRVWEKPFGRERLLDATADATHRIVMTVNGEPSEAYENLVLEDGQRIALSLEEVEIAEEAEAE